MTATAANSNRETKTDESNNGAPGKIADKIRDLIIRGTLAPGVRLGQSHLAEMFGTSRVPIREALKLLAAEMLVTHDPNKGFSVAMLSSEEAQQLYQIRHVLDTELLKTVEWPDEATLNNLRKRLDDLEALLSEGYSKRQEWMAKHRELHRAIFELSPRKILVREVLRLWMLTDRYRSLLPPLDIRNTTDGMMPERHLINALAEKNRELLLQVFDKDRTMIEKTLLEILEARGL